MKQQLKDTNSKQPYKDTISIYFLWLVIAAFIIGFASCGATKRDCQGVKHYRHSNGFYL